MHNEIWRAVAHQKFGECFCNIVAKEAGFSLLNNVFSPFVVKGYELFQQNANFASKMYFFQ